KLTPGTVKNAPRSLGWTAGPLGPGTESLRLRPTGQGGASEPTIGTEPRTTPPSAPEPRVAATAEDVIKEGQEAIAKYRKAGKGSQRGVVSVGGLLFALVVVGTSVYVISQSDDKIEQAKNS